MAKKKEPIIDYVALYKSLMLVGTIFLLMLIVTYMPLSEEPKYECENGTIVDKYIDSGAGYRDTTYILVVDCNGTNRTHIHNCFEIEQWKQKQIGDVQRVCYEV